MELIAWISKAYTPTYPIVKIQDFCFSTRKPFGIKWILHLCPSPHFFRQAFLGEKRAKCSTNLYRGLTQFSFVFVAKGKWQHLIISSGINQTQRSKPWTKKKKTARSKFLRKPPALLLKNESFIPKLKIGSESLVLGFSQALENMEGEQGSRDENACNDDIVIVISPLIESPNMSYRCDA